MNLVWGRPPGRRWLQISRSSVTEIRKGLQTRDLELTFKKRQITPLIL